MAFRIRKPSQESFFALNAIPLYSYAIPLLPHQGDTRGEGEIPARGGAELAMTGLRRRPSPHFQSPKRD